MDKQSEKNKEEQKFIIALHKTKLSVKVSKSDVLEECKNDYP